MFLTSQGTLIVHTTANDYKLLRPASQRYWVVRPVGALEVTRKVDLLEKEGSFLVVSSGKTIQVSTGQSRVFGTDQTDQHNDFYTKWQYRSLWNRPSEIGAHYQRLSCGEVELKDHKTKGPFLSLQDISFSIRKSDICTSSMGWHAHDLDCSLDERLFAHTINGLLLAAMMCHKEPNEDPHLATIRQYQREIPCQVVWWKRASIQSDFIRQPCLSVDGLFEYGLNMAKDTQHLIKFTDEHLLIVQCVKMQTTMKVEMVWYQWSIQEFKGKYGPLVMCMGNSCDIGFGCLHELSYDRSRLALFHVSKSGTGRNQSTKQVESELEKKAQERDKRDIVSPCQQLDEHLDGSYLWF
jgi:hypothetical protein